LRTPFERNIVTGFDLQEAVFDHMFEHLGVDRCGRHPVLLTEAACTPNYVRARMSELLFEAYRVPGVCYGLAGLLSLHANRPGTQDALVLSLGYQACEVLPVVDGRLEARLAVRLDLGGYEATDLLLRLLQLRQPAARPLLTVPFAQHLKHRYCYVAADYLEELRAFQRPADALARLVLVRVRSAAADPAAEPDPSEEEARRLRREQLAEQRRERLAQARLVQAAAKRAAGEGNGSGGGGGGEDEEDEAERERRREARERSKRRKQEEAAARAAEEAREEERRRADPTGWAREMRERRAQLQQRLEARRREAQQARLRHMAEAALDEQDVKRQGRRELKRFQAREDQFGARDEDWQVYIEMQQRSEDDSDAQELARIDALLAKAGLASDLPPPPDPFAALLPPALVASPTWHQSALLGVERVRVPEIFFQPSIVGLDKAGLHELAAGVLARLPSERASRLASCVFLTGGSALFRGLPQRLEAELRAARPAGESLRVELAKDPTLDAWRGGAAWARGPQFRASCLTRALYDERGPDWLPEHFASNRYVPAPVCF
jgi:actin-related protein 5